MRRPAELHVKVLEIFERWNYIILNEYCIGLQFYNGEKIFLRSAVP